MGFCDYGDDIALSYAIAAAEEAARQVKLWTLYNNGIPALPDHDWVIKDGKIEEVPNYTNLTKDHYCFRQYCYQNEHKESWNEDEAFPLWEQYIKNSSINNLFKLKYAMDLKNFIPDGVKLIEMVKFKDNK